jgi:hypothetical protein
MYRNTLNRSFIAAAVALAACSCRGQQSATRNAAPTSSASTATPSGASHRTAGVITGFVFDDVNRNLRPDSGERHLSQQTVLLQDRAETQTFGERSTSADGSFRFQDLAPGEYRVTLVVPNGFVRTSDNSLIVRVGTNGRAELEPQFGVVAEK